jgi:hypothetical protein
LSQFSTVTCARSEAGFASSERVSPHNPALINKSVSQQTRIAAIFAFRPELLNSASAYSHINQSAVPYGSPYNPYTDLFPIHTCRKTIRITNPGTPSAESKIDIYASSRFIKATFRQSNE